MNIKGMKSSNIFEHTFNDSVVATTKLMESLMTQADGQFLRIAPNVFLYFSPTGSKCMMVTSTPLHYFYGNIDLDPKETSVENEDTDFDDDCNNQEPCNDNEDSSNVLIDNQNIDLAHNLLKPNTSLKSVCSILPLTSNDLIKESKDVEGRIQSKYEGQVLRHNDTMFTHIRPDGTIDRVITDEKGHNCTSYK